MDPIDTADKLQKTHATVKKLLGEKWPAKVAELQPHIERIMQDTRNPSPISAVLPAAKAMAADQKNPMVLLAVAVEMSAAKPVS